MVRALLAGTKMQTRRIVKPQPVKSSGTHRGYPLALMANDWAWPHPRTSGATTISNRPNGPLGWEIHCPYGQPGDRLWVRETWRRDIDKIDGARLVQYRADDAIVEAPRTYFDLPSAGWIPSIHMPRWASRLTLEITGVRVERLQDISEADAIAEGWPKQIDPGAHTGGNGGPFDWYRALWESINGPGSWDANPWVWVVSFKRNGGEW
jgi:hypothetical protein